MEVRIKDNNGYVDADWTIEDGIMVVSPKVEKFKPKDGDVVTNIYNGIYQGTGIFDYEEDSEAWIHVCITKSGVLETDGYLGYVNNLRPATEEEKKLLFDKLTDEGWSWDAEKKELVKLKWKPEYGEKYYYPIYEHFKFYCDWQNWDNDGIDDYLYKKGMVFKTDEECQAFCNRLNDAINSVKL